MSMNYPTQAEVDATLSTREGCEAQFVVALKANDDWLRATVFRNELHEEMVRDTHAYRDGLIRQYWALQLEQFDAVNG